MEETLGWKGQVQPKRLSLGNVGMYSNEWCTIARTRRTSGVRTTCIQNQLGGSGWWKESSWEDKQNSPGPWEGLLVLRVRKGTRLKCKTNLESNTKQRSRRLGQWNKAPEVNFGGSDDLSNSFPRKEGDADNGSLNQHWQRASLHDEHVLETSGKV